MRIEILDPYEADPFSPFYVVFRPLADWPGYGVDTEGWVWSRWLFGPGVCDLGPVWRRLAGPGRGRHAVTLRKGGRSYSRKVYRLVLEAFVGPCPTGMEACHHDDDPTNNRLRNLRWDTHKNNCSDRSRNGRHAVGSTCRNSKYDEPSIAHAKALLGAGERVGRVAAITGVHRVTVSYLKKGVGWAHVFPRFP
jgi:hypothetical protein